MKKIIFTISIMFVLISTVNAQTIEQELKELKSNVEDMEIRINNLEISRLDKTYPVGSVYITTTYSSASAVSNAIGGTWEVYSSGRTLIGVNTSDSNFNIVNKTGGLSSITLNTSNLPSHTHSIPALSGTAASAGAHTHDIRINGYQAGWYINASGDQGTQGASGKGKLNYNEPSANLAYVAYTNNTGAHTHSVTTVANTSGSSGSGTSFTNLQPYITVYIYRRIS